MAALSERDLSTIVVAELQGAFLSFRLALESDYNILMMTELETLRVSISAVAKAAKKRGYP